MPGFVFSVDSVEIQNQKADNHHSDNDYLSLVWTVANTATKNVQTFKKTLRVGGVLHTGDVVNGPFMTDPFNMGDGDILTVNLVLVNLGSSDAEEQFRDAVQVTEKVADVAAPVVGSIITTILAGDPAAGAQIGEAVAHALRDVISTFSDIFDFFDIHIGPPNCNGEVFHDTLTYGANEFGQAVNQPASRSYEGPQTESKCGAAPHTKVNFSIRDFMWHSWFRIGRAENNVPPGSAVSAIARQPDKIDLFVVGNDGGIYSTWWNPDDGWERNHNWFRIGRPENDFPQRSVISAIARQPDKIDLFVVGNDGGIYSTWWGI